MPKQEQKTARAGFALFAFLALYFAFEACFVSFISPAAGLDDAELISNLSFWNWGYGGSQPPLYTWLAYGLTWAFGLHFTVLQCLHFGILASGFFAVYLGLRQLEIAPRLAAFSCLSMFLLPQIGWESQRALIHSVLGTAGSAWSFAAFIFFVRRPGYRRAVMLGAAFAAAVLGKYNGLIFIAALMMSAFFLLPVRRAVLTRYYAAAVAAAFIFMAPALLFMARYPHSVMQRDAKFQAGGSAFFYDRLCGILDLARAGVSFVLPALVLALLLALIAWLRRKRQKQALAACAAPAEAAQREQARAKAAEANARARRVIGAVLLCGLAFCAVSVLLFGVTHIKDRWLQPVLFLVPPYASLWLAQADSSGRSARALAVLAVLAACLVPPMLYANLYIRPSRARPPIQLLDYQALYAGLSESGKIAAILAPKPFYAGNLRLLNPQIKTLFAETPFAAERLARPLAILWNGAAPLPQELKPILLKSGIKWQNLPPVRALSIPYRARQPAPPPIERFYYIYLP